MRHAFKKNYYYHDDLEDFLLSLNALWEESQANAKDCAPEGRAHDEDATPLETDTTT